MHRTRQQGLSELLQALGLKPEAPAEVESETPETDAEAWFDNDEGWWVSRSVSRRMERERDEAREEAAAAQEENSQLRYAMDAARADTERLNWLEKDTHIIAIKATVGGWVFERSFGTNVHVNNGNKGLRQAIDTARSVPAKPPLSTQP